MDRTAIYLWKTQVGADDLLEAAGLANRNGGNIVTIVSEPTSAQGRGETPALDGLLVRLQHGEFDQIIVCPRRSWGRRTRAHGTKPRSRHH